MSGTKNAGFGTIFQKWHPKNTKVRKKNMTKVTKGILKKIQYTLLELKNRGLENDVPFQLGKL